MSKRVGIWIDHRKAIVVSFENDHEKVVQFESDVSSRARVGHNWDSMLTTGSHDVKSERRLDKRFRHHINAYYRKVYNEIRDAESIFIFGPGMAKIEIEKILAESKELHDRVINIENANKMTLRQISAMARNYFKAN